MNLLTIFFIPVSFPTRYSYPHPFPSCPLPAYSPPLWHLPLEEKGQKKRGDKNGNNKKGQKTELKEVREDDGRGTKYSVFIV
jgi:hypothetical protein